MSSPAVNNIIYGKSAFEYTVSNVSTITQSVFTPPIATASDMFWEMEFIPSYEHDPDHCALFLSAIPNPEEAKTLDWSMRSIMSAVVFVKDPETNQEIERRDIDHCFSPKAPSWGFFQFFKRSEIPEHDTLIIGIEFQNSKVPTVSCEQPFPNRRIPDDLIDAWVEQVDNPETSDIRFNLNGHFIYANSAILSKRSKYFAYMLEGEWSRQRPTSRASIRSEHSLRYYDQTSFSTSSKFKYMVDVMEFHHETFLEMLRFLYTDQVTFDDDKECHRTAFDMFSIADKYFIGDLRQRAKMEIFENLHLDNVAEVLFGEACKWGDLKEDVLKYFVENFAQVKETDGFKNILLNPREYPRFSEVWLEIMQLVKE
ncbi:14199_t:CDS:2 [Ambispora leptoticha]|uniref:14199_t:CDS:1 n=1 Tax=Ambispora leptoticha TaxID=144679 RepID=A0A9N9FV03_9GLOM|nr:14199_t:CDS:2 [Ambispora leptoticha]